MNTFTFVFTDQELNVIFGALQEKPYTEAAPVIDSIRMQIQAAQEEKARHEGQTEAEVKEEGDNDEASR